MTGLKAGPATGLRTFVILWGGQFFSMTGSGLSAFALGIYAYLVTGSVTTLGLVYALAYLPSILASPFAGSLVDRWGSRQALVVGNVGGLLIMLSLAASLASGFFETWHIYVVVTVLSATGALQMPAFSAALPLLVPRRYLGRANGMRMLAIATSQVLAPVTAGFLLLAIDIHGIILVDCLSYCLALLTLAVVRIPRPVSPERVGPAPTGVWSLLQDFGVAWRYVVARPGLLGLMLFLGALNFCAGFVDLLITPLVLAFETADTLGVIMSTGGIGMIVASLAMSAWGGPRRRVHGVLGFSLVLGVATILGALRPDVILITIAAVLFLGSLAIVISSHTTLWQAKVEPYLLGRTMALLEMVANTPQLIAYTLAGVTADRIFQPLVGREEVRSPTVAALVGNGPGRGIALLLMVMGVLMVACVVVAGAHPRLRNVDTELPDVGQPEAAEGQEATSAAVIEEEPAMPTSAAAAPIIATRTEP